MVKTHYCALRRNLVSPQNRFLEPRFSLFLRESIKVSHSPYPQKFTLSASFVRLASLIRKTCTASFIGYACKSAVLLRLYFIISKLLQRVLLRLYSTTIAKSLQRVLLWLFAIVTARRLRGGASHAPGGSPQLGKIRFCRALFTI